MVLKTTLFILILLTGVSSAGISSAGADTVRRNWSTGYNDYRNALNHSTIDTPGLNKNEDYTVKNTTTNAAGESITTRTRVEYDRNEYTTETRVTGPEGQISAKKTEVEFDNDEIETRTTTTDANGVKDIQRKSYEFND